MLFQGKKTIEVAALIQIVAIFYYPYAALGSGKSKVKDSSRGCEVPVASPLKVSPPSLPLSLQKIDGVMKKGECPNSHQMFNRLSDNLTLEVRRITKSFAEIVRNFSKNMSPPNMLWQSMSDFIAENQPIFEKPEVLGPLLRSVNGGIEYSLGSMARGERAQHECAHFQAANEQVKDFSDIKKFFACFSKDSDEGFLHTSFVPKGLVRGMYNTYFDFVSEQLKGSGAYVQGLGYKEYILKKYPVKATFMTSLANVIGPMQAIGGAAEVLRQKTRQIEISRKKRNAREKKELETLYFRHLYESVKKALPPLGEFLSDIEKIEKSSGEIQSKDFLSFKKQLLHAINSLKKIQLRIEDHPCVVPSEIEYDPDASPSIGE
jgi:hypothetical protein